MTSIRVTDYNGDLDTLEEVFLIGPYPNDAEAEREVERLYQIAPFGEYDFEVTSLSADDMVDPASFAAVASGEEFSAAFNKAFYGF